MTGTLAEKRQTEIVHHLQNEMLAQDEKKDSKAKRALEFPNEWWGLKMIQNYWDQGYQTWRNKWLNHNTDLGALHGKR